MTLVQHLSSVDALHSGDRLQNADAGGTHGDYAPSALPGGVDGVCGFTVEGVPLAVHRVVFHLFLVNGAEGIESDVQCYRSEAYAFISQLTYEPLREV